MDKFEKELNETKNPWVKRIGNYLLSRSDIKENLKKEKKSLEECFKYVIQEISKKCERNNNIGYAAGDDQELFDLAVHYYDEDDLKIENLNFKTNANGTASAEDLAKKVNHSNKTNKINENHKTDQKAIDEAVKKALDSYKQEEKEREQKKKEEQKARKMQQKAKKKKIDESQMDIFAFLGDENESI
ncbi:Cas9 inhibitor AcrIIA9 family protein [Coprobacillus sp. AF33-1AC]|uniref:Cas9 inhibitor AcrIIA9 family protein n=1 Tax=Coprobacillus sp. AF33-1AC TaxID=2292032 RepID=UPI000E4C5FD9|nr:Cas9 inhibitor AcrIIA9 family protein [Coprobacillus sp. AF33-1AC]RHM59673.1 hypothetical protein DWZ53_09005 [Coprobacillus sp. AF33-1AC]